MGKNQIQFFMYNVNPLKSRNDGKTIDFNCVPLFHICKKSISEFNNLFNNAKHRILFRNKN